MHWGTFSSPLPGKAHTLLQNSGSAAPIDLLTAVATGLMI